MPLSDVPHMLHRDRERCPRCKCRPLGLEVNFACPQCREKFCGECVVHVYESDSSLARCPACRHLLRYPPISARAEVEALLAAVPPVRPQPKRPKDWEVARAFLNSFPGVFVPWRSNP